MQEPIDSRKRRHLFLRSRWFNQKRVPAIFMRWYQAFEESKILYILIQQASNKPEYIQTIAPDLQEFCFDIDKLRECLDEGDKLAIRLLEIIGCEDLESAFRKCLIIFGRIENLVVSYRSRSTWRKIRTLFKNTEAEALSIKTEMVAHKLNLNIANSLVKRCLESATGKWKELTIISVTVEVEEDAQCSKAKISSHKCFGTSTGQDIRPDVINKPRFYKTSSLESSASTLVASYLQYEPEHCIQILVKDPTNKSHACNWKATRQSRS